MQFVYKLSCEVKGLDSAFRLISYDNAKRILISWVVLSHPIKRAKSFAKIKHNNWDKICNIQLGNFYGWPWVCIIPKNTIMVHVFSSQFFGIFIVKLSSPVFMQFHSRYGYRTLCNQTYHRLWQCGECASASMASM